jgi:hypothetical protein
MPPSSAPSREQPLSRLWLAAGIGNAFTSSLLNPLDVTKTRMQTNGGSLISTLRSSWTEGGLRGLFMPGLAASILREFVYSGPRIGFYTPVRDFYAQQTGAVGMETPFVKVAAALTTGAFSCILANPIDVVKIRMQRNPNAYTSTFAAIPAIVKAEGFVGLTKGLAPSTLRGMSLSVGQLAVYDIVKTAVRDGLGFKEGTQLHVMSALVTGVAASVLSAPFDYLKARTMAADGSRETMRSVLRTLSAQGKLPGALYTGVAPAYLRQGPHALICWPVMEKLRAALDLDPV